MSPTEKRIASLLRSHPATIGLNDAEVIQIADGTALVECEEGEDIYLAGDEVEECYLVAAGRLAANVVAPNGSEQTFQYLGSGEQVGVLPIYSGKKMPVHVFADEHSVLLKLSKESFQALASQFPLLERNLLRLASVRLGEAALTNNDRRKSRLVGFVNLATTANDFLRALTARFDAAGEEVAIASDDDALVHSIPNDGIGISNIDGDGRLLSEHDIRTKLAAMLETDRIFVSIRGSQPEKMIADVARYVDDLFWIIEEERKEQAVALIRSLTDRTPAWRKKFKIVWLSANSSQLAPDVSELNGRTSRTFNVCLDKSDTPNGGKRLNKGLQRVFQYLRGVQLGLALGGGAALGMAHLGVLQAFEEAGIVFDMISGTSAGAMVGVICSANRTPTWAINQFSNDLQLPTFYRMLPMGGYFYLLSKFRFKRWESMLRKYLGELKLEQLELPLFTVAVDLIGGDQLIRHEGDAVNAILESINLPVLSNPINKPGMSIVDGGFLNNVPADVLFQNGATFVVAVNVLSQIPSEFTGMTPESPIAKMKTPGLWATLTRLRRVQDRFIAGVGANVADFTIEPDLSAFDLSEFSRTPEIAAIGRQAAEDRMAQLTKLITNIDAEVFKKR